MNLSKNLLKRCVFVWYLSSNFNEELFIIIIISLQNPRLSPVLWGPCNCACAVRAAHVLTHAQLQIQWICFKSHRRQRSPADPSTDTYLSSSYSKATLSFEIPPPISVSVRSRQAGTETEREPSAMEALGPGKRGEHVESLWPVTVARRSAQRVTVGRGCCARVGLRDKKTKTNALASA